MQDVKGRHLEPIESMPMLVREPIPYIARIFRKGGALSISAKSANRNEFVELLSGPLLLISLFPLGNISYLQARGLEFSLFYACSVLFFGFLFFFQRRRYRLLYDKDSEFLFLDHTVGPISYGTKKFSIDSLRLARVLCRNTSIDPLTPLRSAYLLAVDLPDSGLFPVLGAKSELALVEEAAALGIDLGTVPWREASSQLRSRANALLPLTKIHFAPTYQRLLRLPDAESLAELGNLLARIANASSRSP